MFGEPCEPAPERGSPAQRVQGYPAQQQDAVDTIGVPGELGVADGAVGEPVPGAPIGRPERQQRCRARFQPLELMAEHLLEQLVVPVPMPLPVQGYQEQVGCLQPLQDGSRSAAARHRVAQ